MDKNKAQNYTAFRHWSSHQDLRYHFFLIMTFSKKQPPKNKKKHGFYIEMSDFIGMKRKNKIQCRSHHQKKIKNLSKQMGNNTRANLEIKLLSQFYKNFYVQRLLGVEKMIEQIKDLLARRIKKSGEFKENYQIYMMTIDQSVEELMSKIINAEPEELEDGKSLQEIQTIQNATQEQNVIPIDEEPQTNKAPSLCLSQIKSYLKGSNHFQEDSLYQNWQSFPEIQSNGFDKFSKLAIQYNVLGQ